MNVSKRGEKRVFPIQILLAGLENVAMKAKQTKKHRYIACCYAPCVWSYLICYNCIQFNSLYGLSLSLWLYIVCTNLVLGVLCVCLCVAVFFCFEFNFIHSIISFFIISLIITVYKHKHKHRVLILRCVFQVWFSCEIFVSWQTRSTRKRRQWWW